MELTRNQILEILKKKCVLIEDTREQDHSISKQYQSKSQRLRVVNDKLDFGDYSFILLPDKTIGNTHPYDFRNEFVIERKSGKTENGGAFSEIRGNLTGGHKAFKSEFQLATKCNCFALLMENTESVECINKLKEYKTPAKTVQKIYHSFLNSRNQEREEAGKNCIIVIHCKKEDSLTKITSLFFEYFSNWVKQIDRP